MPFKASMLGNNSVQNVLEPMQVDLAPDDADNSVEEAAVEVHTAAIDLETYAANYKGLGRIFRLMFIADRCPPLRVEALKMAINFVQETLNVSLYQELHRKLQDCLACSASLPDVTGQSMGASCVPLADPQWVDTRTKRSLLKLEKLDADLKNYRANSIKESIRRGQDDMGNHYLDCGDLNNALKCYSRARDQCTSGRHVVNMCLNVIKVSVYQQQWEHVRSYLTKAQMTSCDNEPATWRESVQTQLHMCSGLVHLRRGDFEAAAKLFIKCNMEHCDLPELISAHDVCLYGGLCALATFTRHQLRSQLLTSCSFKLFLELEPAVRDALQLFYDSRYQGCLSRLDQLRGSLLLDLYLSRHVNQLYSRIRSRALIQYFSPYVSADMKLMATAFNTDLIQLEHELIQLILSGQIQARIDSHSKVLHACSVDQRTQTFERALAVGKEYVKQTRSLLLRTAIHRAQLCVKATDRDAGGHSVQHSMMEMVE